jgi:hypothetical protein
VYFTAAALFAQGELPYRDFVLVHPPGMLLFLAPVSLLAGVVGAGGAFSAARWLVTLLGAANIALSARVAHRAGGPVAAIVAAASYAVLPEIALHERSTYLEPLLNFSCLLLASTWLSPPVEPRARRWPIPGWGGGGSLAAGLCLGLGLSVKAWALLWAPACLLWPNGAHSADVRSSRRGAGWLASLRWLAAGTALALLAINLPFLIAAPRSFLSQTLWFQVTRPADGMGIGFERAVAIFAGSWPVVLIALVGLAGAFHWRRRDAVRWNSARFFAMAWVVAIAAFLVSRTYWPDYNAHLAPAEAHLAGLGGATLWAIGSRHPVARLATIVLLATLLAAPLRESLAHARVRGDLMERVGERVRSIPAGACYQAFEPAWALAGDSHPTVRPRQPPEVDVYATMLLAAQGRERALAGDALRSRGAQERIRELLAGCDFVSLGDRGERQLTPSSWRWIARRWEELPAIEDSGADLWRLRQ